MVKKAAPRMTPTVTSISKKLLAQDSKVAHRDAPVCY